MRFRLISNHACYIEQSLRIVYLSSCRLCKLPVISTCVHLFVEDDHAVQLAMAQGAAALKARVQGSNPGGVGWIAVLGKLLTDHASATSAV